MKKITRDELLATGEVAQLFRVDPKTVALWAAQGKLPSIRTPGNHRRFRRSDVEALLNGGTQVNGVSKEASFTPPAAYCEGCGWQAAAPPGDLNPPGYCNQAAEQHNRDTAHVAVVAVGHLTRYTQGANQ